MYDFIQKLKNFTPEKKLPFGKDVVLVISVACLAVIAFAVLFTDAYIFYTTIIRKKEFTSQEQKSAFPVRDIENIINILNERQKEFVEIISH